MCFPEQNHIFFIFLRYGFTFPGISFMQHAVSYELFQHGVAQNPMDYHDFLVQGAIYGCTSR